MDSLPKLPIDSLQKKDRDEAYRRVGLLCVGLANDKSEEALAKCAGFHTVETMRISLENWGLSALLPRAVEEKKPKERKARQGVGEAEKLPPASRASRLFEVALSTYQGDLYRMNRLEEYLSEDGLFHAYLVYPPEDTKWPREAFLAEEWEELCVERGLDSADTEKLSFPLDARSSARGAFRHPDRWLSGLIGAYLLRMRRWEAVEQLIEKLHRYPQEAKREKIKKCLFGRWKWVKDKDRWERQPEGLLNRMWQLATLIRGGEVKQGHKHPLDMYEQGAALDIQIAREQGVPEEEIERTVRELFGLDEDE